MSPHRERERERNPIYYILLFIVSVIPFHALLVTWARSFIDFPYLALWKEVILILLGIGVLTQINKPILKSLFAQKDNQFVLLYIFATVAYLFVDSNPIPVKIQGLQDNITFFFAFILAQLAVRNISSQQLKQQLTKAILWPAYVVVGFGILQFFVLPNNFLEIFGYGQHLKAYDFMLVDGFELQRIQSTLAGAKQLGAYLLIPFSFLLVIGTGQASQTNKKRASILRLCATALAIFLTFTRGVWLGVLAILFLLPFISPAYKSYKKTFIIGFFTLLILAIGAINFGSREPYLQTILFHGVSLDADSNLEKINTFKETVIKIVQNPLGHGIGTAGPSSLGTSTPLITNNYYLQVAHEQGLEGLVYFLAIIWLVVKDLYQNRKDEVIQALLLSLIGIVIVSFFSHSWTDSTLALVFWISAGLVLGTNHLSVRPK